jgi:murein DD-endopeptidase MepM/ murein hydrolase activator NlpD
MLQASFLSEEKQHHISKDARYTVVINREGDAANATSFRIALWQVFAGGGASVLCFIVLVIVLWTYTPLGVFIPMPNAALENKYGKELVILNQRMTNLMEQLVELRSYNLKLRKAMGEMVNLTDSGSVVAVPRSETKEKSSSLMMTRSTADVPNFSNTAWNASVAQSVQAINSREVSVSFPAIVPTEGYISRGFEPEKNHLGLDIAGKTGTLVVAAAEGNVVFSGWTNDAGYEVIISHANGYMTFYKHNESLLRGASMHVHRGEPIATLGNSGTTSSGPHLHFEIWKDGIPVNPAGFMINLNL